MKKEIYISKEIIHACLFHFPTGSSLSFSEAKRAYEILERSNSLISSYKDRFDLSDAVSNLKRSLDQRLKLIEKIYHLKDKKFEGKPNKYLDLLAHLGIVRPLLLHKLLKIRNLIEHEDKQPPSAKICLQLFDSVWYFLKSTDSLITMERTDFDDNEFEYGNKSYYYSLNINWRSSFIEITGWFPLELIHNQQKQDCFKVRTKKIITKNDLKDETNYHRDRLTTDNFITGELVLSEKELLELYRKIFSPFGVV